MLIPVDERMATRAHAVFDVIYLKRQRLINVSCHHSPVGRPHQQAASLSKRVVYWLPCQHWKDPDYCQERFQGGTVTNQDSQTHCQFRSSCAHDQDGHFFWPWWLWNRFFGRAATYSGEKANLLCNCLRTVYQLRAGKARSQRIRCQDCRLVYGKFESSQVGELRWERNHGQWVEGR